MCDPRLYKPKCSKPCLESTCSSDTAVPQATSESNGKQVKLPIVVPSSPHECPHFHKALAENKELKMEDLVTVLEPEAEK